MELIRSVLLHRLRPSPHYSWVGSCITFFEACSAFTRVTTCRLAKSPYATFYIGGSGGFVASTAAPIATGWSDPVPGRVYLPLWSSALHGALKSDYINCVVGAFLESLAGNSRQRVPEPEGPQQAIQEPSKARSAIPTNLQLKGRARTRTPQFQCSSAKNATDSTFG